MTDAAKQPKLPAANEFTVGQLGGATALFKLLTLITELRGDRQAVIEAIRTEWFHDSAAERSDPAKRLEQQAKRAANVVSGMRQYGLLTPSRDPLALSDLGQSVLAKQGTPDEGYKTFVSFLLRKRHGIELLEVARAVKLRDGEVKKAAVDLELAARGYKVPTNSSYSGKLRGWLQVVGIVDSGWEVDERVFAEFTGIETTEIDAWRKLTPQQRATVTALRIRAEGDRTPISSSDLLELLRQRGVNFDPGQVKKTIYDPLRSAGWINHVVAGGGRGGKGGVISLTQFALDMDVELIDGLELGGIPHELQAHLGRPLHEIVNDLASDDLNIKGTALELLSLRLASECGLLPVDMRVRGVQTGGAEVDLVAEGAHLHFSRWLFQCKNQTSNVGLSVLAKEIGMATLLRAQVVVIVTTGTFAKTVRDFARQVAETTPIQVVLLDKKSLKAYVEKGAGALRSELHELAVAALSSKRHQLAQVPRDPDGE